MILHASDETGQAYADWTLRGTPSQGVSVPASAFAPYTLNGTLKQWRVMAQLSGDPSYPWSAWASFTLN